MKKDSLVQALVKALREGRKTTDPRQSSGTSRKSRDTGDGSRSRSDSRHGREQRGNQTPNTPEVNEKEIGRLTVDQLCGRLRRRGITDTGDMKKDNLVQALVKALREGRKTTRSRSGSIPGGRATARRDDAADRDVTGASEGSPDSPQEAELSEYRRAAELESVPPQGAEVEDVDRRPAEPEASLSAGTALPSPPADAAPDTPELPAPQVDGDARVPDVPTDLGRVDEVEDVERHAAEPATSVSARTALSSPLVDAALDASELPVPGADGDAREPDLPTDLGRAGEVVMPKGTLVEPGSLADAAVTTARQPAGGPEDPLPRP